MYLFGLLWHQLQLFGNVILIFFSAWLISFILGPLANWLQQRRLSRPLAVTVVYLAVVLLVIGLSAVLLPILGAEVRQIAGRITYLSSPANTGQLTNQLIALLTSLGLSTTDAHRLLDQATQAAGSALQSIGPHLAANAVGLVGAISNTVLYSFIALILSFYMMVDGRRLANSMIARLPPAWHADTRTFETHVTRVFGGFIRSQFLIGLSYGILTWVVLAFLGIPSGLIAALIAGIVMIIPFVGPPLALVPPMALVLLEVPSIALVRNEVILVVGLFFAQQIVMQGLAPRIMSYGVGVHPIWLFGALFIGAQEGGVWGAFFAAPIAALISVIATTVYERWACTSPLFATSAPVAIPVAVAAQSSANGLASTMATPAVEIIPSTE